jgi:hypothetical protein
VDDFARTSGTFRRTQTAFAERFTGRLPKGIFDCEVLEVDGTPRLRVFTARGCKYAYLGDWVVNDGATLDVVDDLIFRRDWAPAEG